MLVDKIESDKLNKIQKLMQENESAAKSLGLVVVRVSKLRCIVAKINGAEGGFWSASKVFGPATGMQCFDYINAQRLAKGGA